MKSKKNIYFLVPAVLLIWGLIGYRVYKATATPNIAIVPTSNNNEFKPSKIVATESYSINANYRDPFLGTLASKKNVKRKKTSVEKPKEQINFPTIAYKGIVSPKTNNKPAVYLIQINGQQNLLKLNSTAQEVKLISGSAKEILLEYKKVRQSFPIQ